MNADNTPDEIRAEIDRVRAELSDDVDTLTETANPKNIAKRQANKVSEAARSVKEKIMGTTDSFRGDGADARQSLSELGDSVGEAVSSAPSEVRRHTRGNPLAAGLVAFGLGLLVSSLLPPSRAEREAVSNLQGNLDRLKDQASDTVKEMADNLREPAQGAAESVKTTFEKGAQDVGREGREATDRVQSRAEQSVDTVREDRSR